MTCKEVAASGDSYEFVVSKDERIQSQAEPDCVVKVDEQFSVWYYDSLRLPEYSIWENTYTQIPKCYGLLQTAALEAAGITRLQNLPALSLQGQGVFVAVIDTGEPVIIMSGR